MENSKNNIQAIQEYFGIKNNTALYIYYRYLRSKRKYTDSKYLPYTLQFQNALVYADKTLGIDWINLKFEEEKDILENNGIDIHEQSEVDVFVWKDVEPYVHTEIVSPIDDESNWTVVLRKKSKSKSKSKIPNYKAIVRKIGLFV